MFVFLCAHVHTVRVCALGLFPPRGPPHGLLADPFRTRLTRSVILCNLPQSCLARYYNLCRQPLISAVDPHNPELAGLFTAAVACVWLHFNLCTTFPPSPLSCFLFPACSENFQSCFLFRPAANWGGKSLETVHSFFLDWNCSLNKLLIARVVILIIIYL